MAQSSYLGRIVSDGRVLPEWIDVNNHMNVAFYLTAFDLAVDQLWERFGITEEFINTSNSSTFAVESHITWQQEMALDEPFVITTQMLAYDNKRIHQFMRMYHAEKHYLAATAEWMNLHVNLETRRVAPWPDQVLADIERFAGEQTEHDWPDEAGKTMQLKRPIFSIGALSE